MIGPPDSRSSPASVSPGQPVDSDWSWDFLNAGQYRRRVAAGMPPLIISCATTGGHQKSENPGVPVTAKEQAETAPLAAAAGAQIIHIHGREPDDPTRETDRAERYLEINALIRAHEPEIIIDNTQAATPIESTDDELGGVVYRYESLPLEAGPEIMALNPGPMTFRGKGSSPGVVLATTFDHTERAAHALRERGIKPQVFLYHPGHLDLLEYLITHDALDAPYFVQLVFGQQSGIGTSPDNVFSMVRNLPPGCIFQTLRPGIGGGAGQHAGHPVGRARAHRHGGLHRTISGTSRPGTTPNWWAGWPESPRTWDAASPPSRRPGTCWGWALPANIHQTAEGAIHGRSFPR